MSADSEQRATRYLIARVGLDSRDRGTHVISRAFRDTGFEVIYLGLHRVPDEIIQATTQEGVGVLGISILFGVHNVLVPKVVAGLEEYGALDGTLIIVGGTIPEEDWPGLLEKGVNAIFDPGTPMRKIIDFVKEYAPEWS